MYEILELLLEAEVEVQTEIHAFSVIYSMEPHIILLRVSVVLHHHFDYVCACLIFILIENCYVSFILFLAVHLTFICCRVI